MSGEASCPPGYQADIFHGLFPIQMQSAWEDFCCSATGTLENSQQEGSSRLESNGASVTTYKEGNEKLVN